MMINSAFGIFYNTDPETIVKKGYDLFKQGDFDKLLGLIDDNAELGINRSELVIDIDNDQDEKEVHFVQSDDESLYRWICDPILVYSRTYGKVYIVSQASSKESSDGAERRRSDELGEDSSEDEGDLVLFSDSDSLSAERILREEGGEFTSESEDLDGDFDDDEGDERQERGLDWELEEDKILPR